MRPFVTLLLALALAQHALAQPAPLTTETLRGMALRGIGPALMGGRIADLAVDPRRSSTWYLAVGSGGVWKTENAGTTWTPIFDDQASYSIGAIALDPSNPDVVWVGTGENVSGRHVGWGDGVYKSLDGGESWQRMGLERSEHIGDVVVDPRDGNVVYVAAEGPLWSPGGDRGLYKTEDGGATWRQILALDQHTGVTDVEIDPRNPDVLYAASYQRRRHVWSLLAGGPGSGIHKSTDGGATWRRLERGLPAGDMGKIGLAVSPADPDVVYATIEANDEERGFYRSRNLGESWEQRNPYISGGTGPHYYQEIFASPHHVDRVYQMDVFLHITEDGGETFSILGDGRSKHSDNHAFFIDPQNENHRLAGTDGGLYETFDHGTTWRHFGNLPISQFYKLALDNREPFYQILGGAQDLGTLLGPSRTNNIEGVRNRDWFVPLGADGYSCAFDPEKPDLLYMEWQVGSLVRYDLQTHEIQDIKPQPEPGDPPERFNWDSPLILSPHAAGRLYFGSQRLWRSDDRGNSWTPISDDLTRGQNRYELEMIGRVWSVDALYDNNAMSQYSTLTTLTESPRVEGLIYAGTDDGLVQVHDPSGSDAGPWRRAAAWQGVPERVFVNELKASLHDDETVFAALSAHKLGDFRPLLFESRDRGRSWRSIAGNLPENAVVWSVVQDHVEKDLLFAGTEFGLFVTVDRGGDWVKLEGGIPTIALRDLEIQRRESDVVAASFGRGFYVLDDYGPLRELAAGTLAEKATLFGVRDAWWYVPQVPMQAVGQPSQGSAGFAGPNPPFGAVFTYYLSAPTQTAREKRREEEKKLREQGEDVPFPGWDRLGEETLEPTPTILLTVRNADGQAVRRLEGPMAAGIHRVSWDLRRPAPDPIDLTQPGFVPPWVTPPIGPLVAPGTYRVELAQRVEGRIEPLGEAREFQVRPVPGATLPTADYQAVADFQAETAELLRQVQGATRELQSAQERIRHLRPALDATPVAAEDSQARLEGLAERLAALATQLQGDRVRRELWESTSPSIFGRVLQVAGGHWDTRSEPTATQRRALHLARDAFAEWKEEFRVLVEQDLPAFETDLDHAGAPWTPGRSLPPGQD